jgi:hypothetical protein
MMHLTRYDDLMATQTRKSTIELEQRHIIPARDGMRALLVTPHYPRFCERHDGPPVLRPEDAQCCEHFDEGDYCCYCRSDGEL